MSASLEYLMIELAQCFARAAVRELLANPDDSPEEERDDVKSEERGQ